MQRTPTVPMGEFAELTQIQQDDQSYTVSFPKLDKRETVPAASHWTESALSQSNIPK